ncbi:MAG: PTS system mannose/fructose/sorbose family transporter subunit IID, partial [Chloroflexi bacterium]|nr:PTS system mannose/fructose/sorbose family transporter subunit IID [Chloroflexota bacterium]
GSLSVVSGQAFAIYSGIALGAAGAPAGILGPLIYLAAAGFYTWVFGWWIYYQGYVQGQALVTRLLKSGLLDDVRTGAAVLGTAVLSALGAQLVTVQTGITWTVVTGTGATAVKQTFALQKVLFDALYPSLLPLLTILGIVWLFRRGVSAVTVITYLFGITLASALLEAVSRYAVKAQSAFGVFSAEGTPSLIGIVLMFVAAWYMGQRAKNMNGAIRFIVAFIVVAVVIALLSVGLTAPIVLLSHF